MAPARSASSSTIRMRTAPISHIGVWRASGTLADHDPPDRRAPIDAVLFDLDGVLTPTAEVHRRAWKRTFDRLLEARFGDDYSPFTLDDYFTYVDGKPRYDGVHSFLESRRIVLPSGDATDPPSLDSEAGVGNLKNHEFEPFSRRRGSSPIQGQ
jgi:hypothetical protein